MPTPDFHHTLAANNKITLERLKSIQPKHSADSAWIIAMTYYTALHVVECAMSEFDETDPLRSHSEHLEFLENRSVAAKHCYRKLFILAESVLTGVSFNDVIVKRAGEVFQASGLASTIQKWLDCIEKAVVA
jgi:hypothetical protein